MIFSKYLKGQCHGECYRFFFFFFEEEEEEDEATKPSFVYKIISNINRKEIQQVLKEDQVMALSSAF